MNKPEDPAGKKRVMHKGRVFVRSGNVERFGRLLERALEQAEKRARKPGRRRSATDEIRRDRDRGYR